MNDQSQSHKPRKEDNSQSKRKSIKDECSFCHKKYHQKKDCPNLQKKNKDKTIFNACVAMFGEDESYAQVGLSLVSNSNQWILDTKFSYHMCPYKDWFSSFEEL